MKFEKDLAYLLVLLIGLIATVAYVRHTKEVILVDGIPYQFVGLAQIPNSEAELYAPVYKRK